MPDDFTEVTNEGWLGRIGSAIKGILIGVLLFLIAFPVLWLNEGHAVHRYKDLKEGSNACVSVSADKVSSANDGKLVHLSGTATTTETLRDPVFGIAAKAIRLNRKVQMYQWKETRESQSVKHLGGGTTTTTTYHYEKTWDATLISSQQFQHPQGHTNPAEMPVTSSSETAQKVTLGAFLLGPDLIGKIERASPLVPTTLHSQDLPQSLATKARIDGSVIYVGDSPASPQVGDLRISFSAVEPQVVSVIAKQSGDSLQPWQTRRGDNLDLLEAGVVDQAAMFKLAEHRNEILTWILRAVGLVLMTAGLLLFLRPLSVVADVIPLLGNIAGAGIFVVALLIALTLSSLTIAIAWLAYRPLVSIPLFLIAGVATAFLVAKLKRATP